MSKLNPDKLYHFNKTNQELVHLLSPDIGVFNQELFYRKSKNQETFNNELKNKGIEFKGENYPKLEEKLHIIQAELDELLKEHKEIRKTRLDFDIAKIFHQNLNIPRRAIIDYDFWRYITLFYFIELTKWRWEKNPDNPNNWNSNAKAIFGRTLGLTLNKMKYNQDKSITYSTRNLRINSYRYWWIANKLYDSDKGYYFVERIAEKFKNEEASVQDFLNHLEGNKLLSANDRVSKVMADAILLSGTKFSEQAARDCFMRYNAYSNRLFMDAEEKAIKKEICLLDS